MKRQRERRMPGKIAFGLCRTIGCNNEAMPGRKMCGRCAEMAYERRLRCDARYREAGKCRCSRPAAEGHVQCQACIDKSKARYIYNKTKNPEKMKAWRSKKKRVRKHGKCWCGKPLTEIDMANQHSTCEPCREKFRLAYHKRKNAA